ncbi:MAG: alpha/beta hydrolase [Planctomycetes bacterium]|nr:alpha/beta hydrolase [Planctomycetota bacterium]
MSSMHETGGVSVTVPVHDAAGTAHLSGLLAFAPSTRGIVVLPHGRGTARCGDDIVIATALQSAGFSTLLLDLLTLEEADLDARKAAFRFDIGLLADRLASAIVTIAQRPEMKNLTIGYLAAGYNASVALVAAAKDRGVIGAVVVHDVPPDLGGRDLTGLVAPTLLLGSLNRVRTEELGTEVKPPVLIPNAVERFVDLNDSAEIARLAAEWFTMHLLLKAR